MLGSPNPGYFTYDGDQSAPPDPREANPRIPEGSAGIERTFVAYLKGAGRQRRTRRSSAVLTTTASPRQAFRRAASSRAPRTKMTDEQAELWDGTAGEPFDPNYHKKSDTLDHIDKTALGIKGAGVAYVVGIYAHGPTWPQRSADPRRPHPARTHRVMMPSVMPWRARQ